MDYGQKIPFSAIIAFNPKASSAAVRIDISAYAGSMRAFRRSRLGHICAFNAKGLYRKESEKLWSRYLKIALSAMTTSHTRQMSTNGNYL
jgi:hypothetical protein